MRQPDAPLGLDKGNIPSSYYYEVLLFVLQLVKVARRRGTKSVPLVLSVCTRHTSEEGRPSVAGCERDRAPEKRYCTDLISKT